MAIKINILILVGILLASLITLPANENNLGEINLDNAVSIKGITSDEEITIDSKFITPQNNQTTNSPIIIILIAIILIFILIVILAIYLKIKKKSSNELDKKELNMQYPKNAS